MNMNAKMGSVIANSKPGTGLISLFVLVLTLPSATLHAKEVTTTIDFTGIADESPFTIYHQFGFTISPSSGAWISRTAYGNPPPFIYFNNPNGVSDVTSSIKIMMDNNSTFKFSSVDLYSSVTKIPYIIKGYLKSNVIFNVTGTIPNTFGGFATATNSRNTDVIDTLEITLTNPALLCCPNCCSNNPMGLDNIVLATEMDTPTDIPALSPWALSLLGLLLASVVWLTQAGKTRSLRR